MCALVTGVQTCALPSWDLDKVVPALFAAAFTNAGQICMAIKRLYVHADIHDEVVRRFARLADEIRLGDGMLPDSEMGPVQNRAQYEKLLDLLADTRAIPGDRKSTRLNSSH